MNAHTQEHRSCTVVQIMKADIWQTSPFQEFLELFKNIMSRVNVCSQRRAEHIIVLLPEFTCLLFDLDLMLIMFSPCRTHCQTSLATTGIPTRTAPVQ